MNRYIPSLTFTAIITFFAWAGLSLPAQPLTDVSGVKEEGLHQHNVSQTDLFESVRMVLTTENSTARFLVREQLAGFDFPNDAVGETNEISGVILFNAEGAVIPGESSVVVDITGLTSDSSRRDGYIQRNTLDTANYPTVELVPIQTRNLEFPLPDSGTGTFDIIGNLTIKEATQPTSWRVNVQYGEGTMSGTARTEFTFAEFGMEKPSVGSVLSVADAIRLEIDFTVDVEYLD
ncbi:MAG: YceI family protein [Balneolaceae bacterium]